MTRRALLLAWSAVFAVWTVSLSGDFLKDDESNFVGNPAVSMPSSWPGFFLLKGANSRDPELTGIYRPLPTLSYAVTARLAGFNPFFFHLIDTAGHAANAALVLLIGWGLTRSLPAAAAGAVLFAFHPAQAESVSYVSGARPSVFSLLFCLLALRAHEKKCRGRALAFFAAAVLFKESALGLPFALAAWQWARSPRKTARDVARESAPYFIIAALFTLFRAVVLGHTTDSGLYGGKLASHIGFALSGLAVHVRSAGWPYGQRLCYTLPDPHGWALPAVGAILLAAIAFAFIHAARRRRAWLAGLGWAAAFLLPVSNVIPISTLAADRYLYASFAGLAWLVALACARAPRRWSWLPAAALAAWLVPLCVERQLDWQSSFTIDLAADRASEDACTSALLGVEYFNWGMNARARDYAREGLSRHPGPVLRAYLEKMNELLDVRTRKSHR